MRNHETNPPTSVNLAGVPDLQSTIERLRQMTEIRDSADDWQPPSPDAELLKICQEALQRLNAQNQEHVRFMTAPVLSRANLQSMKDTSVSAAAMLRAAGRLNATTAAGIFAKATVVRASRSGAAVLGQSLAADLIAHPTLRQAMWPVSPEGAA